MNSAVLTETHSDKEHKNPDVKVIHRFYALASDYRLFFLDYDDFTNRRRSP